MTKEKYLILETYMLSCIEDSAHDCQHIYRVLHHAMCIAKEENDVDYNILITACLLHDIARPEQAKDNTCCHALAGGEKAFQFLVGEMGETADFATAVKECIICHRYRSCNTPTTIESKILFDADKLDATGTMGIARTLIYQGQHNQSLYYCDDNGQVIKGIEDKNPSFLKEYKYKLENIDNKFHTKYATDLARKNKTAAFDFYESMILEITDVHKAGMGLLGEILAQNSESLS